MSRMTPHSKILTDLYNKETNKIKYQYKKNQIPINSMAFHLIHP